VRWILNKDFAYWFRWLAVIPGAIGAGLLVLFPLRLTLYMTLRQIVDPYPEFPERLLSPLVIASVFIWVGSKIAPEYKKETSIVLFCIWLFLAGGFVILVLSGGDWMGRQLSLQYNGIGPIMGIIGAFVGLYLARKRKT